jgi:hypothetical protein
MLGPILAVALAPAWAGFTRMGVLQLTAGLAAAGLVSLAASNLASTTEARGRPASALVAWAGAALLFAGVTRLFAPEHSPPGWLVLASVPVGLAVAAAGLSGVAIRRSWALPSFPRLLTLLVATALAGALSPWMLPWLLFDSSLAQLSPWPPNLIFVSLDAPQGRGEPGQDVVTVIPAVELLAVEAVTYDVYPQPLLGSLLRLPDGSSLPPALHATGYATAAIVTDPTRHPLVATEYRDERPGGWRLLEESATWMVGARFLLGPGSTLASLAGQDRDLRSPQQLGAEASRWLLWWRTQRAPTPFFLLVDFHAPSADAYSLDAALTELLDTLWELQLDATTLLIVAIERSGTDGGERGGQAILVPPTNWARIPRRAVRHRTWGAQLSLALLEIARSDGTSRLLLPGLTEGIVPPASPELW